MKMSTVVVPLDGSAVAEAALPYAEALATALHAPMRLMTVKPPEVRGALATLPEGRPAQPEAPASEEYLQRWAAVLTKRGLTTSVIIATGDPVDEILAAADDAPGGVVVMATHGRGGVERWMIGSVADKVMRLCTRPVLLVRPPAPEDEDTTVMPATVALRRILVPLDGSALAEHALEPAMTLVRGTHAMLVLVRVEPWLAAMAPMYGYLPDLSTMDQQAEDAARAYLDGVRARYPDIAAQCVVLRGSVAERLPAYAAEGEIDLTVMTTHGAGGMRRLVLGSNADRLVRSGAPVLLVHELPADKEAKEAERARATRCATCHRLISFAVSGDERCPRCQSHLHTCANCVFSDGLACILQRPEAHSRTTYPGHGCPRFTFRETAGTLPLTAR